MNKKMKIILTLLLTVLLAVTFVGCSDFIPPEEFRTKYPDEWKGPKEGDGPEIPDGWVYNIENRTIDDLIEYLYEKGVITIKNTVLITSIGNTGSYKIQNVEFFRWEFSSANDEQLNYYDESKAKGYTTFAGSAYTMKINGPKRGEEPGNVGFGIHFLAGHPMSKINSDTDIFMMFGWGPPN